MKTNRTIATFQTIILMIFIYSVSSSFSQDQLPQSVNHQDEYVEIDAPPADKDGKLTIFRSGDKAEINQYISRVIELKNAPAFEIFPHVIRAVRLEKGTARPLKYTDPETGELKHYMQVVTTEAQMPSIIETIKAIDLPDIKSYRGISRYSIRMKHRLASEMAEIIAGTSLSGEGKVFADDKSNTLFVEDSISDGKSNLFIYEYYDVPAPQVEFDVQLIQVRESDLENIGIDWDAWKRSLGGQLDLTGNIFEGGMDFFRLDGLVTIDASALASFLNYTTQNGNAKTVFRAKVAGSNINPARISCFNRIPNVQYERIVKGQKILTESNPNYSAAGEVDKISGDRVVVINPEDKFERQDIGTEEEGIFVEIFPVIGTDSISARIRVEANIVTNFNELNDPITANQILESVYTLIDNQTFHLGTVERELKRTLNRGIPGLKRIPGLKFLFSNERTEIEKSKIYIIATPVFHNTVYEERQKGHPGKLLEERPGEILKIIEPQPPEYIKSNMLPVENDY